MIQCNVCNKTFVTQYKDMIKIKLKIYHAWYNEVKGVEMVTLPALIYAGGNQYLYKTI
jgi:hypothetical protein